MPGLLWPPPSLRVRGRTWAPGLGHIFAGTRQRGTPPRAAGAESAVSPPHPGPGLRLSAALQSAGCPGRRSCGGAPPASRRSRGWVPAPGGVSDFSSKPVGLAAPRIRDFLPPK